MTAAIGAALLLGAASARAARLVDVRVGVHAGYARVVLQTDAPAAHEVVPLEEAAGGVYVYLAATSVPRTIPARGGAPSVEIAQTNHGTTVVRIQAATPVRVETQVLTAPPRVVLDLHATPQAEPEPAAVEVPVEPAAVEAPVEPPAEVPEPAPAEPDVPPSPIAPAPAPDPAPTPEPPPTPTPEAVEVPSSAEPMPVAPEAAEPLPPVGAAPPWAFDPRSLATGLALGVALALVAFAARRPRVVTSATPVAAASAPDLEPSVAEQPASDGAPEPGASLPNESAEDLRDFLRMHQRVDARLAEIAARLDVVATHQARLESREEVRDGEFASHRAAIARIKLAIRPAGVPPRSPTRAETTSD